MQDIYNKKQKELEETLSKIKLNPKQKDLLVGILDFGYAAGFCEKVCDMRGSLFEAQKYQDGYKDMRRYLQSLGTFIKSKRNK